MTPELIFLVQALAILVLPPAVWRVLRGAVPLVVVQILVGIALGPTLFGRLLPDAYHLFFNPTTLTPLWGVASIAVLLFSFVTGLHLEPAQFLGRGRAFALVAVASVAVPTGAGVAGGLWIAQHYPNELASGINPIGFATAIGICIGVTALPVLGAILREMDLLGGRIGNYALGIAAVNDAAMWLLLGALMSAVAGGAPGRPGVLVSLLGLPIYLGLMAWLGPPLMRRASPVLLRDGRMSERALAALCAFALGSAMITQVLGLHYIFGAFVAGTVMPHELRQPLLDRLQVATVGVLMPFFFMLTGLRTLIDLGSWEFLEILVLTTALAVVGKVGGTALIARLVGESWSTSFSLGSLVQTNGLMGLIVLTILLDRGIITTNVFSALVLMGVLTTMLAMPMTRVALRPDHRRAPAAVPLAPDAIEEAID
ncbi:MAG TPA: cation:proton antiporter [Candidatus Dormibacteraeota bacterium]|nr:cation:proton antiporter [Candidatus Dormibacteraeota bacterium]